MKRKCVRTPCESVTIYIGQKRARRANTHSVPPPTVSDPCSDPAGRGRQAQELAEGPARAARTARPLLGRLLPAPRRAHGFAPGDDGRMAANIGRRARTTAPRLSPVSVQSSAQGSGARLRSARVALVASGAWWAAGRAVRACMHAWRHVYLCPEKRSTSNSVMRRAQDRPAGWPMGTDGHWWEGLSALWRAIDALLPRNGQQHERRSDTQMTRDRRC